MHIPKSVELNVRWRRKLLEMGYADPAFANAICRECADDALLWLNLFGWLLESRDAAEWQGQRKFGSAKELPFITRPYQDRIVLESVPLLGRSDIPAIKSREMGLSYIFTGLAVWDWACHDSVNIGLVSKDLDAADNPDDTDSLMSKVMFFVERLPLWMVGDAKTGYDRNLNQHTLKNLRNNSTIRAYAATADVATGGRKRWMLMDEFHKFPAGHDSAAMDSTAHVTNCRVIISTVNRKRGASGAFHEIVTNPKHNGHILKVFWPEDEEKSIGLYHSERLPGVGTGVLKIDDVAFWSKYANPNGTYRHPRPTSNTPALYPFVLDEKQRSLYYDWACDRPGATTQSIAAELDGNFSGATAQVIGAEIIEAALRECLDPLDYAEVYRDPQDPEKWVIDTGMGDNSSTRLWIRLVDGKPPANREYAAGADVSLGTGGTYSSYSCLQIFDRGSGEQVLEWRSNRMYIDEFAKLSVFLCQLFNDAYLVPEFTGPGQVFVLELIKAKYTARSQVYHRRPKDKRVAIKTDKIGYDNRDGGQELLLGLQSGLKSGKCHVRSALAIREAGAYFYKNEKVVHATAMSEEDQSARGRSHGDAAIAIGAAWLGVMDVPKNVATVKEVAEPLNCFAARRRDYDRLERKKAATPYWQPKYVGR